MTAYYNEHDKFAAQWLRNLIAEGHISDGEVDERDIQDVRADELVGFTQCHFFAGIGVWSYALRQAGWPDERPVWTGSCPCQPYSVASVGHGGAKGQGDERDHWPDMCRLVKERKPPVVYGEQVADAVGWGWWDRAALDLEDEAYACASAVLRADAIGADHQRKRFYWVADAGREGWAGYQQGPWVPFAAEAPLTEHGDGFFRVRRALDGDYEDLLPGDGVPVAVERCAAKGYGNAIVPEVAAGFIRGHIDVMNELN